MEDKHEDEKDKVPIYGGIKDLNEDQKEVLQLPPNHRTYPKLKLDDFKTELEKCVIKANWQKTNEQRRQEEVNKKNENDDDTDDLPNETKNTINFTNLRATDLKNNKRIIIPNPDDDDEEEIRRNNIKKELEKVYVKYMNEHCDKFGNVNENNLSEKTSKSNKKEKKMTLYL